MSTPKISVISIARNENDFSRLKEALSSQSYEDFELVTSTKGTIPEAWNDAISRAKGSFFVFTESDACPLNIYWLENISNNVEENAIIKGLEIRPTDLNMSNLVADANIFINEKFDESFRIGEDTEMFSRLRKKGFKILRKNCFPVFHNQSLSVKKSLIRSMLSGLYSIKIIFMYGYSNMETINTKGLGGIKVNPIINRIKIILENAFFLIGLMIGTIVYSHIIIKNYFSNIKS